MLVPGGGADKTQNVECLHKTTLATINVNIRIPPCKAEWQNLLTLQVRIYCLLEYVYISENSRRWNNADLMLVQRLKRWTNIKSTLFQRLVFAGCVMYEQHVLMSSQWQAYTSSAIYYSLFHYPAKYYRKYFFCPRDCMHVLCFPK